MQEPIPDSTPVRDPASVPGPPPPLPRGLGATGTADIVIPPRPPLPATPDDVIVQREAVAPVVEPAVKPEPEPQPVPEAKPVPEPQPEPLPVAAADVPEVLTTPVAAGDVLVLRGVAKRFGDTLAVDGIDLTVPAGTFYGLVGPNGAGKTTTLSMIAGLLEPDRGSIRVGTVDAASDPLAAKRLMGVLPDRLRTFDRLTGRQLLYYYGVLRGLSSSVVESRTADLARAFDLTDALGRLVSDYSAGMTKKVMLAGALIHSPRLLVLDEPFEAVDPVSSAIILDILSTYVAHGGTVILSSHGMELVERVCSRVAVIVAGQVLAEGTIDEVRGELSLEQRFIELAGGLSDVEGLEWLHTFSD
ncbi:ABC transporter ATP-binding protein [Microbacterium sp. CFBP9034]|uniref:ABC transporter ATP-binding protein n=1 Tax=Microbacterium sp. CFBP9034 TaxID=3096540 RepID=UPI002A6B630F|nr:ABC transporter ATP-binding protein [Microbacterium sp. CFBP9034]MDY0909342.1 ABC transporter ATP-binding protein [Microbacterium sp. CFBP9034]